MQWINLQQITTIFFLKKKFKEIKYRDVMFQCFIKIISNEITSVNF